MTNNKNSKRHTTRNNKGQFAAECVGCGEGKEDPMNEKCNACNAYDAGER